MSSSDMPQETYRAEAGFLELNTGGGITEHYLTPAAAADQLQAARSINTHCLTGLIPCSDLPDLSPAPSSTKSCILKPTAICDEDCHSPYSLVVTF